MRSLGVTTKHPQHARNFLEELLAASSARFETELAQLVGGVQPDGVTLVDFSSVP
jgi:hypothetical protein